MMAVTVEDGGSGQQWQQRTTRWLMTRAADEDGLQDWAADYDGEGQEWAARDGGGSGVAMMAAAKMAVAEDSGGRQQQGWRQTTAVEDGS
jgi:hypothetical protein